ncbi:MAG: PIN domain-containing protein, partial [Gemmataceae bacterium]|nr:PIN domain-containing protein [Gemmataceae bacterium]
LLDHCRVGGATLASSDALMFEAGRNPHPVRRAHAEAVLAGAAVRQPLTPAVEARADTLVAAGLRPLDALHLASAEAVGADYFCTCDDQLLRRGPPLAASPLRVVSPIALTTELGL